MAAKSIEKTVSCPARSAKTVLSFGFMNAARYFSAPRFYFYRSYCGAARV